MKVYSDKGLGEMSRQFHRLYRDHLLCGKYQRGDPPVLISIREGTYWGFTEETGKEYTGAFLMQVSVARLSVKDHDSKIAVFRKK